MLAVKLFFRNAAHPERTTGPVSNPKNPLISGISENEFSKKVRIQGWYGEPSFFLPKKRRKVNANVGLLTLAFFVSRARFLRVFSRFASQADNLGFDSVDHWDLENPGNRLTIGVATFFYPAQAMSLCGSPNRTRLRIGIQSLRTW
jgi:hypothetical protein